MPGGETGRSANVSGGPTPPLGRPARLLLLLRSGGDRKVLSEWAGPDFELVDAEGPDTLEAEFDLCVLDGPTYAETWQRLEARRSREAPVFLPFVLIAPAERIDVATRFPAHGVDEIVLTPIEPEVFRKRLQILLERRALDLELERDRDAAMEELRRARDELEARVEERTRDLQRELETTKLLVDAAQTLTSHRELDKVLRAFADALLRAVPYKRIAIALYDEGRRDMTILFTEGEAAYPVGTVFPYQSMSVPVRQAIDERRPRVIDYDQLPEEEAGAARKTGRRLSLVAPLVFADRIVGMITIDTPNERAAFTERNVRLVEALSSQAAAIIDNARLLKAESERARLSEALTAIDHSIHGTMSPDEMFRHVLPEAAEALGADSAAAGTREGAGWRVGYEYHLRPGLVGRLLTDDEFATAALAARTQEVVVVDDALTDARVNLGTVRGFDARSFIVGPLVALDEVVGVVYFVHQQRFHAFSSNEVEFVRRLSVSLGLALTNARLYESEHTIAETLQTALLALPDHIPGVEFAHMYHSATEAARVGGDFYDLFELEHQRIGITVGDISGHGIDAAVLTSLVKNAIRVQATQEDKGPNEVMASASQVLYENSPAEIFATVFFGVLDRTDGRLVYCSAGHPTGACVCSGGGVRKLPANSPLMGAFPDQQFELSTECVDVHDLLFLYTDGLTEARRDGELFGEERLFDLLERERGGRPEATQRRVIDKVLSFSGGKLSDDLAILAVARSKVGQET